MTPKEKAQELFETYRQYSDRCAEDDFAKQCALIAVNEISNELTSRGILSGFWFEVAIEIIKI